MRINRGDIFYIEQSVRCGNEIKKDRPGIVVSAEHLNAGESCVEVVFLTSQPKKEMNEHVKILSSGRESTALCEQISSISVSRLANYNGRITDEEMKAIDKALAASLGMNFVGGVLSRLLNPMKQINPWQQLLQKEMHTRICMRISWIG